MEFTLFMDESGDHGLDKIDPTYPVFVLCGVMFSDKGYQKLRASFNEIKQRFWGSKEVIFHSSDIRRCRKEFKVLLDNEVKREFYEMLDACLKDCSYRVIAAGIDKQKYINTYGRIADDPYEISLSFIIERAIFMLDDFNHPEKRIRIVIEKRGTKEDNKLASYFEKVKARGTGYVGRDRIQGYDIKVDFKDKKENINGLQVSDLIAYPIARYIMDKERANPSFDIFADKFYSKNGKRYGLKEYP